MRSVTPKVIQWGALGLLGLLWGVLRCIVTPSSAFVLFTSYSAAYSRQFEVGTSYHFKYETSVLLNEPQSSPVSSSKEVGYRLELDAQVTPLWQHPSNAQEQILLLKISSPSLFLKARQDPSSDGFVSKPSRFAKYKVEPFFLHWKEGLVSRVYCVDEESLSLRNLKKGIASLFQYQIRESTVKELDSSGMCDVIYKVGDEVHLTKIKRRCRPSENLLFYNQTNKVLAASIESQVAVSYELDKTDRLIRRASGLETHILRIGARKQTGSEVVGRQTLVFQSQEKSSSSIYSGSSEEEVVKTIGSSIRKTLKVETLATTPEDKECIACKSLTDLVNNFKNALSAASLATQSSAIAFIRILGKMRQSEMETIKSVLANKKFASILPQLLDIATAAQTLDAYNAAKSVVNFSGRIDLPERFLLGLSLSTHPEKFIIEDLMAMAKKGIRGDKLYETLVLTLASVTNTFAQNPTNSNETISDAVKTLIISKLDKCSDENCRLTHIRALKNLRHKETIPKLSKFVESKSRKTAIYAMRALQTMPEDYIDNQTTRFLERIFFQLDSPHDSSIRAMAADVLLRSSPTEDFLRTTLYHMNSQETRELNTLLLGRIKDLRETNSHVEQLLKRILKDPQFNNYHILGQNGLSSSFSRQLSKDIDSNSSFSSMLEISGGLLKRSTVDVFVDSEDAKLRLFSFGIFAGGLNMFGSGNGDNDDEEANAGIELTLRDTQLRPFVFFTGQGELMGHVWSGTASEKTSALHGSFLLQDHYQVVPLQNGFNADLSLTGVLSYDLAGQIQISLWNRNAHSLVEAGAALVMQGQMRVDTSFVQTSIEFNTGAQTKLNFIIDLDFYDEIIMCLQMEQPSFKVIENIRKFERIPGSNYILRKYKKRSSPVAGKTYVMNKKNTDLCNKMFNK